MIFYSVISTHNLHNSLKFFKSATSRYHTLCRLKNFGNMSQKVNQNKTYVAVSMPQTTSRGAPGKFPFFRRNLRTDRAAPKKRSELGRLLSLAKKEKWALFGKQFIASVKFSTKKVMSHFQVEYVYCLFQAALQW